jgi:hypothetical protein
MVGLPLDVTRRGVFVPLKLVDGLLVEAGVIGLAEADQLALKGLLGFVRSDDPAVRLAGQAPSSAQSSDPALEEDRQGGRSGPGGDCAVGNLTVFVGPVLNLEGDHAGFLSCGHCFVVSFHIQCWYVVCGIGEREIMRGGTWRARRTG